MEEQVVEEVVKEQVAEAPDTSEIEAAYLRERDAYVAVRDAYVALTQEGAEAGLLGGHPLLRALRAGRRRGRRCNEDDELHSAVRY